MIIWTILSIENEDDRRFAETLYDKYYVLVKNTILKTIKNDTGEIDDLIHDVFVKLIDSLSLLQSFTEPVLMSYIAVVSRNIAINYIRRSNKKSDMTYFGEDDVIESIGDENNLPDELYIIREEQENLYKILKQLSEKNKLLLQLKYFYDMSDKDIARFFDISPDSVKVYISRARQMAYKLIKGSGVDNDG